MLLIAALIAVGAAMVAIVVATGALQLGKTTDSAPTAEQLAQQRCQAEVLERLVAPDKATISDAQTQPSTPTSMAEISPRWLPATNSRASTPSRISVLNVSGVPTHPVRPAPRSTIASTVAPIDGALAHTLIVFDHGH